MNEQLPVLDQLQIAAPCPAKWDDMAGDARCRFCGGCEKHVYNIAAMTPEEAVDLIQRTEGRLCVRLFRRTDGTVLTTDCPVGLRARLRWARRRAWAAAAAVVAGLTAGIHRLQAPTRGQPGETKARLVVEPASPLMGAPVPLELMGDIAVPEDHFETMGEMLAPPRP